MKKSVQLLKIEEDVWHIILGGACDGSKAIDEGLKLSFANWEKAGLLSIEFGNSVLKENVEWNLLGKKTIKYRVFSKAADLANMRTLPVGTDGQTMEYLRDVKWLESLIEKEHDQDRLTLESDTNTNAEIAKKTNSQKGKKHALDSDPEEDVQKTKKKKKTKQAGLGTRSKRRTRQAKTEYSPESKSFLFDLEQLELEDHVEVQCY